MAAINNNLHAVLSRRQSNRGETFAGHVKPLATGKEELYVESAEVATAYPWHSSAHSVQGSGFQASSRTSGTAAGYAAAGGTAGYAAAGGAAGYAAQGNGVKGGAAGGGLKKGEGTVVQTHSVAPPSATQLDAIMTGQDTIALLNQAEAEHPSQATAFAALPDGLEKQLDLFRLFTDEGTVAVYAQAGGTVGHLKEMVRRQLSLSPRLEILLQPSRGRGGPLPDGAPIVQFSRAAATQNHPGRPGEAVAHARHAPPAANDDLSLSSRPLPLSDFDVISPAAPAPEQLRVRACKGGIPLGPAQLVRGIRPHATVNDLKRALLQAPALFPEIETCKGDVDKITVYFSPVFFAPDVLMGRRARSTLPGVATLASCKLVTDDILYVEYVQAESYHKPIW